MSPAPQEEVVIVSAVRSPFGKFGGALKDLSLGKLGGMVFGEAIKRAGISPEDVDEVAPSGHGHQGAREPCVSHDGPHAREPLQDTHDARQRGVRSDEHRFHTTRGTKPLDEVGGLHRLPAVLAPRGGDQTHPQRHRGIRDAGSARSRCAPRHDAHEIAT